MNKNARLEIKDGKISDQFKKGTLLFLLKESNISDEQNVEYDFFWFSEVVQAKLKNPSAYCEKHLPSDPRKKGTDKVAQTKYFNFLNGICKELGFNICECSYVNLNPFGGGSAVQNSVFSDNIKYSSASKIKQIKELCPKAIICCGTYDILTNKKYGYLSSYEITNVSDFGSFVEICGDKYAVISTKHPASQRTTNKDAWESIRKTFQKMNL
jgi:hypothetical protein